MVIIGYVLMGIGMFFSFYFYNWCIWTNKGEIFQRGRCLWQLAGTQTWSGFAGLDELHARTRTKAVEVQILTLCGPQVMRTCRLPAGRLPKLVSHCRCGCPVSPHGGVSGNIEVNSSAASGSSARHLGGQRGSLEPDACFRNWYLIKNGSYLHPV